MAFQLSPGVNISEVDLTTVVPSVATTVGGIAGEFTWGPANTIVTISNEVELVDRFGKPDANSANAFFTAANFLSYGSDLRVVRAVGANAKNAGVSEGVLVRNEVDYQTNQQTVSNSNFFLAKYAGALGNSIGVSLCDASSYSTWAYKDQFDSVPATSAYATNKGSSSDEIHLIVYDKEGKISGTAGTILEKFGYVSKASDAKNSDGSSNYYKDVLNNKSKYVWFKGHISLASNTNSTWGSVTANGKTYDSHGTSSIVTLTIINGTPGGATPYANGDIVQIQGGTLSTSPNAGSRANATVTINGAGDVISLTITGAGTYLSLPSGNVATSNITGTGAGLTVSVATSNSAFNTTHPLTGGVDDSPSSGLINSAFDLFQNADSTDISLLMAGATSGVATPNHLIALAESRKDCLVFVSPDREDVVDNYGDEATDVANTAASLTKSSYAVMDSGYKYQYDKYNDTYRWIPLNGDIAGLCVRTDSERDPWFSPAGLNRGVIKNVVKLAWNPTKAQRDTIYKAGVNPVVTFPGEGTILYGDKTLLNRPQAMDRINVRRLFIVLEKSIAKAARSSLFEFNDEFTRAAFVNIVEPYLREVQGRRGIYDFRVVCDTTNNTAEVIDQNQFVGDIYIKPARSINFIQLNFTAVRTGVEFEEIVGRV
jgi:phage tail sheath protein FI